MDPLSQATIGALAPQATTKKKKQFAMATLCGAIAGMAPDLDVLIQSKTDPLLFLEYHRQFTHSLLFIPIGGFICAGFIWLIIRSWRHQFKSLYFYSTLGYATHGLLDSCTSYGTLLFWPITNYRVSWDIISIIDPVFTLPLLALAVLSLIKKQRKFALYGCVFAAMYFALGVLQNHRAVAAGEQLAAERGHTPLSISAKPSFANLLVFKTIYQTKDRYYVDAVRVGWAIKIYEGQSIAKLDLDRDFPQLDKQSQSYKDILRFSWFSQGYVALHPTKTNHVIDVRYSMLPNEIDPLWGIKIPNPNIHEHVDYLMYDRKAGESTRRLLDMLRGRP